MKITDEMIRSGALVLCPHLDQLPVEATYMQRKSWSEVGYVDQAAVLDDARMVLEAGLIAAPPVEYAGLVERLRAEEDRWQKLYDFVVSQRDKNAGTAAFVDINQIKHAIAGRDPVLVEAADAITALEARAREAERELARINGAIAVKGGTEHSPTEDAYSAACRALEKHRERADAAEARIRELEAALTDPNVVHLNMLAGRIAKPTVMQILHLYSDQLFHAAVLAEREACAQIADHIRSEPRTCARDDARGTAADFIAAAIRARPAPAQPVEEAGNEA